MSDQLIPLNPADDPRAREAVINLLGATLSELREIDKNVVGSSRNISALKTDLKNVFNFQQTSLPTQSAPVATAVAAGINSAPQPQITYNPVQQPAQPQVSQVEENPAQLVFDFNQKITPETINNKLDRIFDKLDRIINLLED